jgi:methionyl-tRNA formyltransferase
MQTIESHTPITPPDTIVFFGGGPVMIEAVDIAREFGWSIHVFSAERHLDGVLPTDETLREALASRAVETVETSKLDKATRASIPSGPSVVGLSFDAPWIFRTELIDQFGGALFNSHGMRLPQYRGGGGFTWAIQRGTRTGYSLFHQITPGIDDGAVAYIREYVFPGNSKLPEDYFRFALEKDLFAVREFMDMLKSGEAIQMDPQPEYMSLYFPRLYTDINGAIDWSTDSESIAAFIDSFDAPYPGAFSFICNAKVRLFGCTITQDGPFHPFQAGLVYRKESGAVFVATRTSGLRIELVEFDTPNQRKTVRLGDRMVTAELTLDQARIFRPIFGAHGITNLPSEQQDH